MSKGELSISTDQKGFSLIELLTVAALMGVLVAISMPTYLEFRRRAFDSRVVSDVRNMVMAQDAYFIEHGTYTTDLANLTAFSGFSIGVTASVTVPDPQVFQVTAGHIFGTRQFVWDSALGGFQ